MKNEPLFDFDIQEAQSIPFILECNDKNQITINNSSEDYLAYWPSDAKATITIGKNPDVRHNGCITIGDNCVTDHDDVIYIADQLFGQKIPEDFKNMVVNHEEGFRFFMESLRKLVCNQI